MKATIEYGEDGEVLCLLLDDIPASEKAQDMLTLFLRRLTQQVEKEKDWAMLKGLVKPLGEQSPFG